MWHGWLRGIFCVITKATSSWYKHHWTLVEYTPPQLSRRNNHVDNLVQTQGCKKKKVHRRSHELGFLSHAAINVCAVCLCECMWKSVCEGGEVETIFHLTLWSIRYSTWRDMMIQAQLRDGVVWKMWWQGKRKTRLWSDIWEGERERDKRKGAGRKRIGKV